MNINSFCKRIKMWIYKLRKTIAIEFKIKEIKNYKNNN